MVQWRSVPERVTHTILKVNEVVLIDPHQVSAVEVKISFLENITKSFSLCLFLILGVTGKRSDVCDLRHQKSCLTLEKAKTHVFYYHCPSTDTLPHHWGTDCLQDVMSRVMMH